MKTKDEIKALNDYFEKSDPQELLGWALDKYGRELVFASSFSVEDVALIDMAYKARKHLHVVTLDTGRLPQETYHVMEQIRQKYNLKIDVYFPDQKKVEDLVLEKGFYSFKESVENRKECCFIRKVEPLTRALKNAKAWVTGQRRAQATTRRELPKIQVDRAHGGILKFNPLADWTLEHTWQYVRENGVPYNALYDAGYRSIGCAPCTRAVEPQEDERAGRWWWEHPDHKECGIHRS